MKNGEKHSIPKLSTSLEKKVQNGPSPESIGITSSKAPITVPPADKPYFDQMVNLKVAAAGLASLNLYTTPASNTPLTIRMV